MKRTWPILSTCVLTAIWLAGCGGGGGGGSTPTVDGSYNFTAAGVLAGVDSRAAGTGRIRGELKDSGLNPVIGETVTLTRMTNSRDSVGSISTSSNSSGAYVFGNVPPGTYRVQVQSQTLDVSVVADADVSANFSNVTPNGNGGGGGTTAKYKWTIMVFMNADNDLEGFGVQDVNELERLADSNDVAIVVLMDRIRGYDTSNNNWTDARRFQVRHDEDTATMTSARSPEEGGSATVLGEIDAGNAAVVKSFIEYCQTNFPATNYVFDFWNHGAGWRKRAGDPLTRGVLYDDTQRTNVETSELDDVLNVADKVDIALFDSSLMQMMEVAYQLRNRCDFVVGSEESPPGEGYPYNTILAPLITNPETTPETLAAHIVNNTVDTMGTTFQLTQSALRASKLVDLADAISAYGDLLRAKDGTFHSELTAARTSAQRYGSGVSLYEGFRDLIDFCDQVSTRTNDAALIAGRNAVRDALTAALVAERHSGSGLANSHGLSIFIPSSSDWSTLRSKYLTTDFAINGRWDDWLDDFYNVP